MNSVRGTPVASMPGKDIALRVAWQSALMRGWGREFVIVGKFLAREVVTRRSDL